MVASSVDKNNSGFVSVKFNLILLLISTLIFKTFLTKFSKET